MIILPMLAGLALPGLWGAAAGDEVLVIRAKNIYPASGPMIEKGPSWPGRSG
jgi:hypothetical protein